LTDSADPTTVRLNKFIAESGRCSRREADLWIERGRVRINGAPATLGTRVAPGDRVEVDGKVVAAARKEDAVYIAYNKPVGVVCVTDLRERNNIIGAVGHPRRIFPVGRLDKASEGLILLTSDGDIVNRILRAGNGHEKEYVVQVDRPIDGRFLRQMQEGVPILDTVTRPCRIRQDGSDTFTILLTQGLNRQIRRMCEALGYDVRRLRRTRVMHITLGDLPPGRWRDLDARELAELRRSLSGSVGTEEASRWEE
jgi:23S rRNA pseudouridine2604 synthase